MPADVTGRSGGEAEDAPYLGARSRPWRDALAAAGRLAVRPRVAAAILWARLTGRRLRARQMLAAATGIDHRLALPARILRRAALAPEPAPSWPEGARPGPSDDLVLLGDGVPVPGARARIAQVFAQHPDIQAVYGDALVQACPGGPVLPLLPPAFDPDLLAAVDYLGPLLACRRGALPGLPAGPAESADPVTADPTMVALGIAGRHGVRAVAHLPEVLSIRGPAPAGGGGRPRAAGPGRALPPLPAEPPLVTVIVPTRDRLDLLRPCLDSLRACTDWPALEILVCDNDSREPETLAYLRALEGEGRGGVVPCPGPFNFAAMNNAAAARARGSLLAFVNNDVEAFRADWLSLMVREAVRPGVGAVGARLLDAAGRIQHGGIVLGTGGGLVTHAHRHFPGDAPGYLSRLRAVHAASAVTAACLVVETGKFRAVGGFDADDFAVDFNDVDLCLRLTRAGYRTLMVPAAVLHHREAASRRPSPEARARHAREVAALRRRWGPLLAQDPHYHPGFDPDLSTHARLRPGFPSSGAGALRRPPA